MLEEGKRGPTAVPECPQKDALENTRTAQNQSPSSCLGAGSSWMADKSWLTFTEHLPALPHPGLSLLPLFLTFLWLLKSRFPLLLYFPQESMQIKPKSETENRRPQKHSSFLAWLLRQSPMFFHGLSMQSISKKEKGRSLAHTGLEPVTSASLLNDNLLSPTLLTTFKPTKYRICFIILSHESLFRILKYDFVEIPISLVLSNEYFLFLRESMRVYVSAHKRRNFYPTSKVESIKISSDFTEVRHSNNASVIMFPWTLSKWFVIFLGWRVSWRDYFLKSFCKYYVTKYKLF